MSLPTTPTTRSILLVESEPMLLKYVRLVLERAGFRVFAAATSEAALQMEQNLRGSIDLLLTGVSMPRLSGPVLAEILERRSALRVMIMSSDPGARTLAHYNGWHFIQKPFSASNLLERIINALGVEDRSQGLRVTQSRTAGVSATHV